MKTARMLALLLLVGLVVGAGVIYAVQKRAEPTPMAEQPHADEVWLRPEQLAKATTRVVEATPQDLPQVIRVGGTIAFDDLRVTQVYSPVTGRVTQVLAQPGQRVQRGTPLLTIVSPDVGQTFSELVKAQADLEAAEADYERQELLLRERAASQRDYEGAKDLYRKAKAEHNRALRKAALFKSGAGSAVTHTYTLRAPIDGEVIARSVNPGVEVQGQYSGGSTSVLFTIGDIQDVWVFADVQDLDLPRIKPGGDATVEVVAYPGRTFRGKVDWIAGTADPALRTTRVRCVLANQNEELKPGMFATVAFAQPPKRQLVVPRDALVRISESTFLFVAEGVRPDGTKIFRRRPVLAGQEVAGLLPILDGLKAGERVVVEAMPSRDKPNDEVWVSSEQLRRASITLEPVRRRARADVLSIGGRVAFDDLHVSHVFSPVNGRLTKVLAELGQRVQKGTPLLSIKSPDVGQWFADALKAQADLVLAQHEYKRQQELYRAHATSQREVEAAENSWRKAKAEFERAEQKTRILGSGNVDRVTQEYVLRSPIAGEVIARKASPGMEIQGQYSGGNAAELFTIGDLGQLWVLGDVYEIDRPHINEGDRVTVRVSAYPQKTFSGVVDWVSDVVDPVLRASKIRCIIQNDERLLKPEMYESVDIAMPGTQLLAVPREAVLRADGETVVFVRIGERKPDGRLVFQRRKIVAKLDDNSPLAPVLSGLAEGETIAVRHSLMLLGML